MSVLAIHANRMPHALMASTFTPAPVRLDSLAWHVKRVNISSLYTWILYTYIFRWHQYLFSVRTIHCFPLLVSLNIRRDVFPFDNMNLLNNFLSFVPHESSVVQYLRVCMVHGITTCFIVSTDINECASMPCQNAANCTDGVNLFTCKCAPGYTGTLCKTSKCGIWF